jgi:hypothetical protein
MAARARSRPRRGRAGRARGAARRRRSGGQPPEARSLSAPQLRSPGRRVGRLPTIATRPPCVAAARPTTASASPSSRPNAVNGRPAASAKNSSSSAPTVAGPVSKPAVPAAGAGPPGWVRGAPRAVVSELLEQLPVQPGSHGGLLVSSRPGRPDASRRRGLPGTDQRPPGLGRSAEARRPPGPAGTGRMAVATGRVRRDAVPGGTPCALDRRGGTHGSNRANGRGLVPR